MSLLRSLHLFFVLLSSLSLSDAVLIEGGCLAGAAGFHHTLGMCGMGGLPHLHTAATTTSLAAASHHTAAATAAGSSSGLGGVLEFTGGLAAVGAGAAGLGGAQSGVYFGQAAVGLFL